MLLQFLVQVLEESWGRRGRALGLAGGPGTRDVSGKPIGIPSRIHIGLGLGRDGSPASSH